MAARGSRTDVVLILVAVALVAAWFGIPRAIPDDPSGLSDWADSGDQPPRRMTYRRGTARVELERAEGPSIQQRYVAKFPPSALADPSATDRLMHALSHLDVARVVTASPESLGLRQPAVELEFDARGEKRQISLGNLAPSPKGGRYAALVRGKQRRFVVLGAGSAERIDIDPESLLDHRLIDSVPSEIHRLEQTHGPQSFTLEQRKGGRWVLADPSGTRARRSSVSQLLLALTELKVSRLLDPATAARALGNALALVISLRTEREDRDASLLLKYGGSCPTASDQLVVTAEGERALAGCVEKAELEKLLIDPKALIDDAAFSLRGDEVERLEVSTPSATWSLQRDGAEFRLKTESTRTVTLRAGNALLDSIASVRGTLSGHCDFFRKQQGTVLSLRSSVVGDDGPTSDSIRLGPIDADGTQTICRDDGNELAVSAAVASRLAVTPTALRDPRLIDVAVESITEIRLGSPTVSLLLRSDKNGVFGLVEPKGARFDAAAVETLRERLSQLSVSRWLSGTGQRIVSPRSANAWLEFSVSPVASEDNTVEPATGNDRSLPKHHELRLVLGAPDDIVGWFDEEPTPFQVDATLARIVTDLLHEQLKRDAH
jgi:hypothetical protein